MQDPRTYPPRPILSAAAVVIREDGCVLLVQRGRAPNLGRWTFPGGAVDLGETVRECAARETWEETGLRVEAGAVVEVVDAMFRDGTGVLEYHYVIVDLLARPVGGQLTPADDVRDARWVAPAAVADYDLAPPSAEVLAKALELWRGGT